MRRRYCACIPGSSCRIFQAMPFLNYPSVPITSEQDWRKRVLSTFLWLNSDELFYSSKKITGDTLPPFIPLRGSSFSGTAIDGTPAIGCVSSFNPTYTDDDIFHMVSFDFNGFSYIDRLTVLYLLRPLPRSCASFLFIYFMSRHFSKRVVALRESMHSARMGNYKVLDSFQR